MLEHYQAVKTYSYRIHKLLVVADMDRISSRRVSAKILKIKIICIQLILLRTIRQREL